MPTRTTIHIPGRARLALLAVVLAGCLAVLPDGAGGIPPAEAATTAHSGDEGSASAGPSRSWPSGLTATGQPVTWTARRSRHASFHQSRRWWGAASTTIRIRGAGASHTYAFHLHLPHHVRLTKNHFGEIVASRHGHKVGILGRPWARNAVGRHLSTWYTVHRRTVYQHIRFGVHTRFPVTADPWWNPFTWRWGSAFTVGWSQVRSCGNAAVTTMSYLAAPTVATNVLLLHVAGRAAVMVPGGAYAYAGLAVYGCIGSYFED